ENNKIKILRFVYIRIAFLSLMVGLIAVVFGLFLDYFCGQYPIYTITVITLSLIILLIIDITIIKNAIKRISSSIEEQQLN
ncbi:MAG: hypothetical protein Q7J07_03855, partial [Pelolinea sp.]|nr:hypothetical protein [Pelolinea sp.]